jgi:hypothetical protein
MPRRRRLSWNIIFSGGSWDMISLGRDLLAGLAADPELRPEVDAIAAVRLRNNFLKNSVPSPGTVTP